uniref:Uncharacterized protein n=1 Tax=Cucumis melo TaxID=3656 RepID=A0A9I9E5D5_CUCME
MSKSENKNKKGSGGEPDISTRLTSPWHPITSNKIKYQTKIKRAQVGFTHSQSKPIRNIQINLTILGIKDWQKGAAKRRIIRGRCPNLDLRSRRKDECLPI